MKAQSIIRPSSRYQRLAVSLGLLGIGLAAAGATMDREQFWHSYLLAYIFWLEIGLGCLGLLMLHHLVGGRWSGLIRRIMESGAMTMPLLAVLFIPIVLGMTDLYPWTDPTRVQQSELLQQKIGWLNVPFFLGRAALYLIVWLLLAWLLNRWSIQEDETGNPALATRMRNLSAIGIILFVLTATFAGYDWMMSLEPEWFSSIYGLLFIAGQGLAALSLAIIGFVVLARTNGSDPTWIKALNDLGNLLLGFVMIWAYFSFSQFLVIWSADIPEEAIWYYHRTQGGWQYVAFVLIALHFILPFLLLLARGIKRSIRWLPRLAALIFVVRLVDLFWMLVPAFHPEGLHLHWLDLALLAAIGGIWLALFIHLWTSRSSLPLYDPHLAGASHGGEVDKHHEKLVTV